MLNQKLQGMVSGSLEASEIRRKLSDYFAARSDVDTVLLFGSFAKGGGGLPVSDYDGRRENKN